jgi:hypothetical protein
LQADEADAMQLAERVIAAGKLRRRSVVFHLFPCQAMPIFSPNFASRNRQ